MLYTLLIAVLFALSMAAQEFIPVMDWAHQARLLLLPTLFFSAAVTVPYPVMLGLAVLAGFLWDARNVVEVQYSVDVVNLLLEPNAEPKAETEIDLPFGFTILLYGILGSIMQGVRPLFQRGRWELPTILVGVVMFLLLLSEYLFINFQQKEFYFPKEVWEKIIISALPSMAIAPLVFLLLSRLAKWAGYRIRIERHAYAPGAEHGR